MWCGLEAKNVLVSSSSRCMCILIELADTKVPNVAHLGAVVCTHPGIKISEQKQVFFFWNYFNPSLQLLIECILSFSYRAECGA